MIEDLEQYLTPLAGHEMDFSGTEYGANPYDTKIAGGAALKDETVAEPLHLVYEAVSDIITLDNLDIQVVASVDGVGGAEEVLASTGVLTPAQLTAVLGRRVLAIPPGSIRTNRQFIAAKFVTTGAAGAGFLKASLMKGSDVLTHNQGANIGPAQP